MIYQVVNKQNKQEVYRYSADNAIEWSGIGFATHDHIEVVDTVNTSTPQSYTWSRLEFLRLFTQAERAAIRTAAKQNIYLEDYLELLDNTTEVISIDPDTIASVNMLEQAGLISEGRAQEILGG